MKTGREGGNKEAFCNDAVAANDAHVVKQSNDLQRPPLKGIQCNVNITSPNHLVG